VLGVNVPGEYDAKPFMQTQLPDPTVYVEEVDELHSLPDIV
jgi:hypothetical protein